MSRTRKFAVAAALIFGGAALSGGPALAFGGGHGGGGGGFGGGGFGGGGHAGGGFSGGHAGGFDGGHAGGVAGGAGAGGDHVFTGRSVGIDRGGYRHGFYRDGRWYGYGYDCGPLEADEGLCPYYDSY